MITPSGKIDMTSLRKLTDVIETSGYRKSK